MVTYMRASAAVLALLVIGACASVSRRAPEGGREGGGVWDGVADGGKWAGGTAARIERARPLVMAAAAEFKLPPDLLLGLIWVESRFKPNAVSRVGARGLTQLMPGTAGDMAERLGMARREARPHNPTFAIRAGAAYLRLLLDKFKGDVNSALAAYGAGPGRIGRRLRKDGGLPKGARRYAGKVQRARRRFRAKPLS